MTTNGATPSNATPGSMAMKQKIKWMCGGAGVAGAVAAQAGPALAHHMMDGKLPQTFAQGLLSGLGHPVIGPDHLAFIVAIGIAAALVRSGTGIIAAFIAMSIAGVLLHVAKLDVPVVEPMIAASVIAAGLFIAIGQRDNAPVWLALAAMAGLVHGYAFGETIVGAETKVLGAYLIGIAVVAAVIASVAMLTARKLLALDTASPMRRRIAGGALGVIGIGFLALSLVAA